MKNVFLFFKDDFFLVTEVYSYHSIQVHRRVYLCIPAGLL